MELIKGSDVTEVPRRPTFSELVGGRQGKGKGADEGSHFIRFRPDGSLATIKKEEPPPPVSEEEIHQRRLEKLEREVYQKAFAEGEKTGLEIGQEKMEQEIRRLIPQFESVLRKLDNLPLRVFAASEQFMVESLLAFNRELLAHELTINPQGIAERVRRIMGRSTGRKDIVIRVSPGIADILNQMIEFEAITIEPDNQVAPGSVIMESDFGGMEDNLEFRLRQVENAFRQQLQERLNKSGIADLAESARKRAEREMVARLKPLAEDAQPAPLVPEEPPMPASPAREERQPAFSAAEDPSLAAASVESVKEERQPAPPAPEEPPMPAQRTQPDRVAPEEVEPLQAAPSPRSQEPESVSEGNETSGLGQDDEDAFSSLESVSSEILSNFASLNDKMENGLDSDDFPDLDSDPLANLNDDDQEN